MSNLNLKQLLSILLIGLFFSANAQGILVLEEQKIEIDHLENIYIIDHDNLKLQGEINNIEYQNNFFGEISSVDVSNPLRILVFHKEANQIVFLNNELSIIGNPIVLDEISLPEVKVVCASEINGFWIYNSLNNRIEFYNSKLQKEHSSINLTQYISSVESIEEIKMVNEMVYLRVSDTGILLFDMFATYIKTIPIPNSNSFQILENSIVYSKGNKILVYDFKKLTHSVLFQNKEEISFSWIINPKLFYLSNSLLKSVILK